MVAKYGDKSVYFDLEDLGNTTGQWDVYGSDAPSPYNSLQVCNSHSFFLCNCLVFLFFFFLRLFSSIFCSFSNMKLSTNIGHGIRISLLESLILNYIYTRTN